MSDYSHAMLQLVESALAKYGEKPTDMNLINHFREKLMGVLSGTHTIQLQGTFVSINDFQEDFDDDAENLFCFTATTANIIVIVSAGSHTPDERLQYMKETYPCMANCEFDVPIYRPDGSWIIYKKDACILKDFELNGLVNAGPCNSYTLESISNCLLPNARVITIGANDDCSLGAGINQKQTDEPGKLVNIPGVWDNFINTIKQKGINPDNLSVSISRWVLFPNPLTMPGTPYFDLMGTEKSMTRFIGILGKFFASRPPPKFGLRVNEGNSVIVSQFWDLIIPLLIPSRCENAYTTINAYRDVAIAAGLSDEYWTSAILPIFLTCLLGGVYKPGVFGWGPSDVQGMLDISCLTSESAAIVRENLYKLPFFTPGYDVIAFLMLEVIE